MHELLLFGQVPADAFDKTLNQVAGVTRMSPQRVLERHLIFKAAPPPGLGDVQNAGSQSSMPQELKKVHAMLSGGLFYVQLVGRYDLGLYDNTGLSTADLGSITPSWTIEFKDIPEAGTAQQVTARLASKTPIEHGNAVKFMASFGYKYLSQYVLEGYKAYDQNTTFFLNKTLILSTESGKIPDPATAMPPLDTMTPLDPSGAYVLQASIDLADSNNPELRRRGTEELLALKETFRGEINLQPAERLSLDTRVNTRRVG